MADRVKRLREITDALLPVDTPDTQAEIERLTKLVEVHKADAMREIAEANEQAAKIDRLRGLLREARGYVVSDMDEHGDRGGLLFVSQIDAALGEEGR